MDFKRPISFRQKKINRNFINNTGLLLTMSSWVSIWSKYPNITTETFSHFVIAFSGCFLIINGIEKLVQKNVLIAEEDDEVATVFDVIYWSIAVFIISPIICLLFRWAMS